MPGMSAELMYARFSQAQLTRYADDWHGLVEWYGESDESDVPTVSVPERSLDLFEFLLTDAGSPVRLKENDEGVIRQPDDVEPWLLADVGDWFEPCGVAPAEVAELAAALARHPFDALVARVDSARMAAAGVALVPDRGWRRNFDKAHYEELALFFAHAAAEGQGLIIFYGE